MLRGRRVFMPVASSVLAHRPAALAVPTALAAGAQQRQMTDKILFGTVSSLMTCSTTLLLFHLLVAPVGPTVAAATAATAAASGALCIIDGGESAGTGFGSVVGVFIGVMGGYYAKSQQEPWRK